MYNTLNLSIFSLYLKALEFILAPNLKASTTAMYQPDPQ
jgi:hypothetical protein